MPETNDSIYHLDPLTYAGLVEQIDETIDSGDLDEEAASNEGEELLIQVHVPDADPSKPGKLFKVVGVEPRDDGKAVVLNLHPVGSDL